MSQTTRQVVSTYLRANRTLTVNGQPVTLGAATATPTATTPTPAAPPASVPSGLWRGLALVGLAMLVIAIAVRAVLDGVWTPWPRATATPMPPALSAFPPTVEVREIVIVVTATPMPTAEPVVIMQPPAPVQRAAPQPQPPPVPIDHPSGRVEIPPATSHPWCPACIDTMGNGDWLGWLLGR